MPVLSIPCWLDDLAPELLEMVAELVLSPADLVNLDKALAMSGISLWGKKCWIQTAKAHEDNLLPNLALMQSIPDINISTSVWRCYGHRPSALTGLPRDVTFRQLLRNPYLLPRQLQSYVKACFAQDKHRIRSDLLFKTVVERNRDGGIPSSKSRAAMEAVGIKVPDHPKYNEVFAGATTDTQVSRIIVCQRNDYHVAREKRNLPAALRAFEYKLVDDAQSLPAVCADCFHPSGVFYGISDGSDVRRCTHCRYRFARLRDTFPVDKADLLRLDIDPPPLRSLERTLFEPPGHCYGARFITRKGADVLCELYYGNTFDQLKDCPLSEATMIESGQVLEFARKVAECVRTMYRDPCLFWHKLCPADDRVDSFEFWLRAIDFATRHVKSGFAAIDYSPDNLKSVATSFWHAKLYNEHNRFALSVALRSFFVYRNTMPGALESRRTDQGLDEYSMTTAELTALSLRVHNKLPCEVLHDSAAANEARLHWYTINSAALHTFMEQLDVVFFDVMVDLLTLCGTTSDHAAILTPAQRVKNFLDVSFDVLGSFETPSTVNSFDDPHALVADRTVALDRLVMDYLARATLEWASGKDMLIQLPVIRDRLRDVKWPDWFDHFINSRRISIFAADETPPPTTHRCGRISWTPSYFME